MTTSRLTRIVLVIACSFLGVATAAAQGAIKLGVDVDGTGPQVFTLPEAPGRLVCRLVSADATSSLRLSAIGAAATDVVATDASGPFQLLITPASAKSLRVTDEGGGNATGYTVRCTTEAPAQRQDMVARGYALRATLSGADYVTVYDYGRTDWSRPTDRTTKPVRDLLTTIAGLDAFGEHEPVVVFIGIAGLAKIVVVDPDQRPGRPDRDHLDPTNAIWVAYLEDDFTPYQTSVDIQFNKSSRIKFDQFEPGSSQLSAAAALGLIGKESRPVRVGFKRVPLRLPMDMQIAFTRQGGLYGFRQWQKSLTVRRGWADVSLSLMVPTTEINLNTHALEVTDKYPPDGVPDWNLIVQESRRRQIYAAVRVGWPGIRAHGQAPVTGGDRLRSILVPDAIFGIGFPTTGATASFVGGAWPIPRLPWLHLTAGYAILWQSRLKEIDSPYDGKPLAVGSKVPLEWTADDIVSGTTPVGRFTFGLAVDLFTWP